MADHPRPCADVHRPGPAAATAVWMDACARAGWRARAVTERVMTAAGLGRVTAAAIRARWPSPRFDCAAMDGIAVRAADVGTSPDDAAAATGQAERRRLPVSAFTLIDTGEPMPALADTVVQRERVEYAGDGSAWITGLAPRGLHVRARGEDFREGQLLIPAGHRLRPVDLAAAAAGGHAVLDVVRPPRVAIIPTGDEIRPTGSHLGHGEIADSNSIMLAAQAEAAGARPTVCAVQPDDAIAIDAQVRHAATTADLVLVIAGSSAGRRDHTAEVLAMTGGVAVRGVAVRPGHPVLLGYVLREGAPADSPARPPEAVPVIGVPGYPLAAAVVFELFAAPLLAALQGIAQPRCARQRVQLACDWRSPPDVEDWVPVLLAPGGPHAAAGEDLATPSGRGAGAISRLLRADAWWLIPIGQANFARGEYVDVQPIPGVPARFEGSPTA